MAKANKKLEIFLKIIAYAGLVILFIIIILFLIRFLSPREIDDVTPGIQCDESLLSKSDVLWVIPAFDNKSIAENRSWCNYILSLNKTLGMHGVYHKYQEFSQDRNESYIETGINDFQNCFGYKTTMFKAPQLALNDHNRNLLKKMGFSVQENLNQITHKVYHCSDTGRFSNNLIDWF